MSSLPQTLSRAFVPYRRKREMFQSMVQYYAANCQQLHWLGDPTIIHDKYKLSTQWDKNNKLPHEPKNKKVLENLTVTPRQLVYCINWNHSNAHRHDERDMQ